MPSCASPARRHWHLQRSLALLQLGRFAEARADLAALAATGAIPDELAALWHWRHVLLAQGEGDRAEAIATSGRMAAALDAVGMVSEHRIMGHYDLAKFWSGPGDPARAFANWQAGHDLLWRTQPFDRAAHRAVIDASIAHFPRAVHRRPARGKCRSGAGVHRRHAALRHHARADVCHSRGRGGRGRRRPPSPAVARRVALEAPALDAAAADYLSELHALAPVNARGLGRWHSYVKQLAPLIAELDTAGALVDWDAPTPATQTAPA